MLPGMLDWLEKNMTLYAGHDEGAVYMTNDFFVASYVGDGVWHLFKRDAATVEAGFTNDSAYRKGCGLGRLQRELDLAGFRPKPPNQSHTDRP